MTLRELVQQAGGINSPQMDFEMRFSNPEKWTKEISKEEIEINHSSKAVLLIISHRDLAFLKEFEI